MIERKPDAGEIDAFLGELREATWLGPARQWWPKFVFHFADLQNAVRILEAGKLVCRSRRPMARDTGSAEILGRTLDCWKDYVRLYFRPRTPTQYQIEGFRIPADYGSLGQHMPVPIFFLFDAKEILTRQTTKFTKGNLAQDPPIGNDAEFLRSIPFEKVYHDRWLTEEEKPEIKFHRHAEVVVPNELDLMGLNRVWCRSEAEMDSLIALLSQDVARRYQPMLRQGRRPNLHFCYWSFVERAVLDWNRFSLEFNRSTRSRGPFAAHLRIENCRTSQLYEWRKPDFFAQDPLNVRLPQIEKPAPYNVQLSLNEEIAFASRFIPNPSLL